MAKGGNKNNFYNVDGHLETWLLSISFPEMSEIIVNIREGSDKRDCWYPQAGSESINLGSSYLLDFVSVHKSCYEVIET